MTDTTKKTAPAAKGKLAPDHAVVIMLKNKRQHTEADTFTDPELKAEQIEEIDEALALLTDE